MPLYLKTHSYGEYVFDWDWVWADTNQRSGVPCIPKLLCAVPFPTVSGVRLLSESDAERELRVAGALALAQRLEVSSLHVLYPPAADRPALARAAASRGIAPPAPSTTACRNGSRISMTSCRR
jgi:uncharacterized protein